MTVLLLFPRVCRPTCRCASGVSPTCSAAHPRPLPPPAPPSSALSKVRAWSLFIPQLGFQLSLQTQKHSRRHKTVDGITGLELSCQATIIDERGTNGNSATNRQSFDFLFYLVRDVRGTRPARGRTSARATSICLFGPSDRRTYIFSVYGRNSITYQNTGQ